MRERDIDLPRVPRVLSAVFLALLLMLGGGVAAASATTDTEESTTEESTTEESTTEESTSEESSTEETSSEAPQLSIVVESTMDEVESGDEVTYTAVLENLGASAVEATVVVSVPDYVTLDAESASSAAVSETEATWVSSVEASSSAEFTIDAAIGTIPDTERRVTTLVSVFVGDPAELIVRTADAANIVGVEDLPNEVAEEAAQEAATADDRLWLTVGLIAAAAVFLVLLIVTIVVVRARRARAQRAGGRRARES